MQAALHRWNLTPMLLLRRFMGLYVHVAMPGMRWIKARGCGVECPP